MYKYTMVLAALLKFGWRSQCMHSWSWSFPRRSAARLRDPSGISIGRTSHILWKTPMVRAGMRMRTPS